MIHKYFLLLLFFIVLFLFFCFKKQKENFDQPKWEKTLKCLKFDQEDIDTFKEDLLNGKDTNRLLSKIVRSSRGKGLDDNQVFSCLMGEF
jgi:hypothetical protein